MDCGLWTIFDMPFQTYLLTTLATNFFRIESLRSTPLFNGHQHGIGIDPASIRRSGDLHYLADIIGKFPGALSGRSWQDDSNALFIVPAYGICDSNPAEENARQIFDRERWVIPVFKIENDKGKLIPATIGTGAFPFQNQLKLPGGMNDPRRLIPKSEAFELREQIHKKFLVATASYKDDGGCNSVVCLEQCQESFLRRPEYCF